MATHQDGSIPSSARVCDANAILLDGIYFILLFQFLALALFLRGIIKRRTSGARLLARLV